MGAPRVDRVLLVVLTPLWILATLLHARELWQDRVAYAPIYVQPAADAASFPSFVRFWTDAANVAGLEPGDTLVSAGGVSLQGAGRVEVISRAFAAVDADLTTSFEVERGGLRREASLTMLRVLAPWRMLPLALGFGISGLLVLWRGVGLRAPRTYGVGAVAYSLHWSYFFCGGGALTSLGLVFFVGGGLFMPLFVRSALLVPQNAPAWPAWVHAGVWVFALFPLFLASWLLGAPLPGDVGFLGAQFLNLCFFAVLVAALVRNYRRSDASGRRQLRWVLYGISVGVLPAALASGLTLLRPELRWTYDVALVATIIIPACIVVAILRYHFLDVDRLITSTAAYTLVTIAFVAAVFTLVPVMAGALARLLPVEAVVMQLALSIGFAAVLVPAQRRVREPIERIFFHERHALAEGVEALRRDLAQMAAPEALLSRLGDGLASLLRLDTCAIYARAGGAFAPVYAHGPAVPPGFDAEGGLPLLLEDAEGPIGKDRWRRWLRGRFLGAADRAGLQSLAPRVILPVKRGDQLRGFVCLGEKASGDVFTPTDLALLQSLSERVAAELMRFDDAELLRQERSMTETLASYVPAAVTEGLKRGDRSEPGEREVTVLFVDIRGYTGFSRGRTPDEIFAVVNAYTTEASAVIRRHGGAVVEFHGDGLMAVFGAPQALANKEEAAVEAGCEVVTRVEQLRLGAESGEGVGLSAGVGIATGLAYVGDIQAVDRRIWGCIGNTTNLAARLQGLTRELDASVVMDAATQAASGARSHEFLVHKRQAIKGLDEALDVWARALARG